MAREDEAPIAVTFTPPPDNRSDRRNIPSPTLAGIGECGALKHGIAPEKMGRFTCGPISLSRAAPQFLAPPYRADKGNRVSPRGLEAFRPVAAARNDEGACRRQARARAFPAWKMTAWPRVSSRRRQCESKAGLGLPVEPVVKITSAPSFSSTAAVARSNVSLICFSGAAFPSSICRMVRRPLPESSTAVAASPSIKHRRCSTNGASVWTIFPSGFKTLPLASAGIQETRILAGKAIQGCESSRPSRVAGREARK